MPYITEIRRAAILDPVDDTIKLSEIHTPGELNYAIQQLALSYLEWLTDGMGVKSAGYIELNDVVGVMEAAKLEFYRRVVVPYEDIKITENGDVF